jgi:hypothetical protein|tara:strand:- start:90 stop:458 length:369 start_codon:yes stop_codon:yes gene_type:complete
MANETNIPNPAEMSKEEMEKKRKEIHAYYKSTIPSLKTQLEYEGLLRDIEKTRAERLQAQMFIAQSMAGPGNDDMPAAPSTPSPTMNVKPDLSSVESASKSGKEMAESIKKDMKRSLKRAKS